MSRVLAAPKRHGSQHDGFQRQHLNRLTQTIALFKGLTPEVLERVMALGFTEAAQKDTVIFNKGAADEALARML